MSVYIKGFPLPNNCGACPLRLAWCRERIYMVTRPDRCPLVPVPEHGRLIDKDWVASEEGPYDYDDWVNWALDRYMDAPVVIPADKEETE